MYNRRVLAGEFAVVNKHLLRDLTTRGLWTASVRNQIIADQGSVQRVDIPQDLKVGSASAARVLALAEYCCSSEEGSFWFQARLAVYGEEGLLGVLCVG